MRVLVTGAAGFLGSHVAVEAARRGFDVVGVDSLVRGRRWCLSLLEREGVRLLTMDVADPRLPEEVGRVDWVVHAAAFIDVEESTRIPEVYSDNNVTKTVALAHRFFKRYRSRFLFVSSAAVYGEPRYLPLDEEHPVDPVNPYGASKAAAELLLASMARSLDGFMHTVIRPFNMYGPGQGGGGYAGVITRFIERLARGEPPEIYGDGRQVRDFLYVEDAAEAVVRVIEREVVGHVINLGSGRGVSINELFRVVSRALGVSVNPVYRPPRPGDVRASYASIERAVVVLGWRPRTGLEEGIRRTVEWFLGRGV